MRKACLLILIFLCNLTTSYSAISKISFKDVSDKGEEIEFYCLDYPFFDLKSILGKTTPASPVFILDLDQTTCIYSDIGPYQCYVFVEPGKEYILEMPDLESISDDWKQNPFFRRELFQFRLETMDQQPEQNELNEAIRKFNREYEPFLDRQIIRYYDPELASEKLDSFISENPGLKGVSDQDYYDKYILYKTGVLVFSNRGHDLDMIIKDYFTGKKPSFEHPAYRELFNLAFQQYFSYLSRKQEFRDLPGIFYRMSLQPLLELLKNDPLLENDQVLVPILLHEMYTAYYSGQYDKKKTRELCDTIYGYFHEPYLQAMTGYIKEKFISMEQGFPVADFNRVSLQGDTIRLSMLRGRYIYLGFIERTGYSSLQEVEYLKTLYQKHSQRIQIINFLIDNDPGAALEYIQKNSISWPVIQVNKDDKLLQDYKIRGIPVFYLIDKDGTLLHYPAASPSENFEYRLFELLRYRGEL